MNENELLQARVDKLAESNEFLIKAVKMLNERVDLEKKRYDILFQYCKELHAGIELLMGS